METLMIQLPLRNDQHEFNLKRWTEICADPELADIPFRVETDRYGDLIMRPPPGGMHSFFQGQITSQIQNLLPGGGALTECPISTLDGVRAADAAWFSKERHGPIAREACFPIAPEICVEILSPSNSLSSIDHKRKLYFQAGAEEVWICDQEGRMSFWLSSTAVDASAASGLCPDFPGVIEQV